MKPLSEDWKEIGLSVSRFANPAMDMLDALYKTKYNAGDLRPIHDAIGAIIEQNGKYLMMDHVKFNFWTIPIGKVEPMQTIEQGLKQELKEEINIIPVKYIEVGKFTKKYKRDKILVTVISHVFKVDSWRGTIKNNEPKKHRSIKWMTKEEIVKLTKAKKVSDNVIQALKWM